MATEADLKALGEELHRRLLDGDDLATSELCDRILPIVTERLRNQFRREDDHVVQEAISQAFLAYIAAPTSFDPNRLSLSSYLGMAARGDLLNIVATLRRRQRVVELSFDDAEYMPSAEGEGNIEQALIDRESPLVQKVFELVTDEVDREIVRMMMDDVRKTSAYAAVLGIAHLPVREQAATVKRHKDRLKALIRRKIKVKTERR
jgi:RNA polymerase sigma-70 factor (ECF subfamily)